MKQKFGVFRNDGVDFIKVRTNFGRGFLHRIKRIISGDCLQFVNTRLTVGILRVFLGAILRIWTGHFSNVAKIN